MARSAHRTKGLTHLDAAGRARMVNVSKKAVTLRRAVARAEVVMQPGTLRAIAGGAIPKGDVLAAARIAGIQAAKRTDELIPLCHALPIDSVSIAMELKPPGRMIISAEAVVRARTGVEMEALVAASVAALTIYDMCKAMDRGMTIGPIVLLEKSGGRSGTWRRGRG